MTINHQVCNDNIAVQSRGFLPSLLQAIRHQLKIQQFKADVQRERKQLAELSLDALNDIGISREQAVDESRRRSLPAQRLAALLEQR